MGSPQLLHDNHCREGFYFTPSTPRRAANGSEPFAEREGAFEEEEMPVEAGVLSVTPARIMVSPLWRLSMEVALDR